MACTPRGFRRAGLPFFYLRTAGPSPAVLPAFSARTRFAGDHDHAVSSATLPLSHPRPLHVTQFQAAFPLFRHRRSKVPYFVHGMYPTRLSPRGDPFLLFADGRSKPRRPSRLLSAHPLCGCPRPCRLIRHFASLTSAPAPHTQVPGSFPSPPPPLRQSTVFRPWHVPHAAFAARGPLSFICGRQVQAPPSFAPSQRAPALRVSTTMPSHPPLCLSYIRARSTYPSSRQFPFSSATVAAKYRISSMACTPRGFRRAGTPFFYLRTAGPSPAVLRAFSARTRFAGVHDHAVSSATLPLLHPRPLHIPKFQAVSLLLRHRCGKVPYFVHGMVVFLFHSILPLSAAVPTI